MGSSQSSGLCGVEGRPGEELGDSDGWYQEDPVPEVGGESGRVVVCSGHRIIRHTLTVAHCELAYGRALYLELTCTKFHHGPAGASCKVEAVLNR